MTLEDLAAEVRLLRDRMAIIERVSTSVCHADMRAFDRQAACYADFVQVDYADTLGETAQHVARDALMAHWRKIVLAFDGMAHAVTNVEVAAQTRTRAETRSYVRATHWRGGRIWTSGGAYEHALERSAAGDWLICGQKHVQLWEEGDRGVFEEAMRAAGVTSALD